MISGCGPSNAFLGFIADGGSSCLAGKFGLMKACGDSPRACQSGTSGDQSMPSHSMHASTMNDECLDDEMKMTGRRLVVEPAPMQGYEANFASISRNWKFSCQGLP